MSNGSASTRFDRWVSRVYFSRKKFQSAVVYLLTLMTSAELIKSKVLHQLLRRAQRLPGNLHTLAMLFQLSQYRV